MNDDAPTSGTRSVDRDDMLDPKPTVTLARLYEEQGFPEKASGVYREILASEPGRAGVREALQAIEERLSGQAQQRERSRKKGLLEQLMAWQKVIRERKKMLNQNKARKQKILVVHGPNLNMLGRREPSVYGSSTLEEINEEINKAAEECGMNADTFQSNHEGALIEKICEAINGYDAVIINPAAYTHTSVAIRDALLMLDVPIIEVHLSNIYRREPFRHKSMIADVATAQVTGFGKEGYMIAVRAVANMISDKEARGAVRGA